MPRTSKKKLDRPSTSLQREIKARGIALSTLASQAQVSTKTVIAVNDGEIARSIEEATADKNWRKLAGHAASLTRLSIRLGLRVPDVLAEYQFAVDEPAIRDAVIRASAYAARPQVVTDPTLSVIQGRIATADDGAQPVGSGKVNLAVLTWEPFYEPSNEQGCFAYRYMHMLLKSIDPDWTVDLQPFGSIPKAIQSVVEDAKECDLIFGLYDTAFRRSLGLSFVPVPGFFVPLGAVVIETSKLTWHSIIDRFEYQNVVALAISQEAGYHLLAGACNYPHSSLQTVSENKDEDILAAMISEMQHPNNQLKDIFFVADKFTCLRVVRYAESLRQGVKETPRKLKDIQIPKFKSLEDENRGRKSTPSYSVGIGIRADAKLFGDLLIQATRTDVFQNGVDRVAHLYVELMRKSDSQNLWFDKEGFESALSPEHFIRFNKSAEGLIKEMLSNQGATQDNLETKFKELALSKALSLTPIADGEKQR